MKYQIQMVRLTDENFHDLHALFNTISRQKRPFDTLKSKYNTAYLGEKYYQLGYLAYDNMGQVVGFNGFIPQSMQVDGKQIIILQSSDSMVLASYRRQGVFQQIGHQIGYLTKSLGVTYEIGFPNQNSHSVMINKLGWQLVNQLYVFQIPIQPLPILNIVNRIPLIKSSYQKRIRAVLKEYFAKDFQTPKTHNGLVRDTAFYQYKNYTNAYSLKLSGLKIWLKVDINLTIGDVWIDDIAVAEKGLMELKQIAKRIGARKVVFLLTKNHPAYPLLEKQVAPQKGNALIVRRYSQPKIDIDWSKITFTRGDYDTF